MGTEPAAVPSRIVVGTDGSATAERAAERATALATVLGAELIVVSAYASRPPSGIAAAGTSISAGWRDAVRGGAETVARETAERARAAGVSSVSHRAEAGNPSEVLLRVTRDERADLLVVGSKGMQSTARFLLGPIADRVSHSVDCDLLIVETSG